VETQFGGPKAMTSFDRMLLRMNPQLDFVRPNQPGGSKARWVESGEFAVSAVRIILALGPLGAYWIQPPAEGRDFHCDRHSSAGRCCAWYIEGVFSPRFSVVYCCCTYAPIPNLYVPQGQRPGAVSLIIYSITTRHAVRSSTDECSRAVTPPYLPPLFNYDDLLYSIC
jgi:hypothetical protein